VLHQRLFQLIEGGKLALAAGFGFVHQAPQLSLLIKTQRLSLLSAADSLTRLAFA
jgi:hypothetical protein